jgi:hypothetical protein
MLINLHGIVLGEIIMSSTNNIYMKSGNSGISWQYITLYIILKRVGPSTDP